MIQLAGSPMVHYWILEAEKSYVMGREKGPVHSSKKIASRAGGTRRTFHMLPRILVKTFLKLLSIRTYEAEAGGLR